MTEVELMAAHGVPEQASHASLERARASLVAFGRHRDGCRKGRVVALSRTGDGHALVSTVCTCGLDDAIADVFRACAEDVPDGPV